MGIAQEFREFAVKGNVIDLAVGVIIGGAFGKIVDSVVSDLILPVVGLVFMMIKQINRLKRETPAAPAAPAAPPEDIALLREIRDSLRNRQP